MRSWRKRALSALALTAFLATAAGMPAASHRPPPHRGDSCEEAIASSAVELVRGWKIMCADIKVVDDHGRQLQDRYLGLEDPGQRTITVQQSPMEAPQSPLSVLYHELGHAWAEDHLTPGQRKAFANSLGQEDWNSGDYEVRATEVWARTWQHCFGFPPDYSDLVVPCSAIASLWGAPVPVPDEGTQSNSFYLLPTTANFLYLGLEIPLEEARE